MTDIRDVRRRATAPASRWRLVEHHPVVASTNALALERARAGEPPGLVIVAERQTAGRGRLGRTWTDQPGGSLAVTALTVAPVRPTLVPLAAGLAVLDAASQQDIELELKWPNDVLAPFPRPPSPRKCAGILVETTGDRLAIGIGVNVDWRRAGEGPDARWGSLAGSVDRDVDRWQLLEDLLRALDVLLAATDRDSAEVLGRYRARCRTVGRDVTVELPDRVLEGRAVDVDDRGALLVLTPHGQVTVQAGDVRHVR